MYVHTSTFLGPNFEFLPQSGNFSHFWAQCAQFWAQSRSSGPRMRTPARFGLRFGMQRAICMSCTCTPARFGIAACILCLRVEFCAHFWAQCAHFWAQCAQFWAQVF
jgi:hypothetical protein